MDAPLLDRKLQRTMLEHLRQVYPKPLDELINRFQNRLGTADARETVIRNLAYLRDHELVSAVQVFSQYDDVMFGAIRLTGKGFDFLEDDGGLRAILGVITVKIHEDSVKQLVETGIAMSKLSEAEKHTAVGLLKSLGATGMKKLTEHLMAVGIEKMISGGGDLLQVLRAAVG